MTRLLHILGSVIILLAMVACADQSTPPDAAEEGAPDGAEQVAFVVPTPSSEQVGIVTGQVLVAPDSESAHEPVTELAFYLGEVLQSDAGDEGMVRLSKDTSPRAMPDGQGYFAFTDVPPGRYGLWLDAPTGALLLNQPVSGDNMIIEITGGDTVELGELQYEIDLGI